MNRRKIIHLLALFGTLLLDQITKQAVVLALPLYGSIPVIPGFFELVHVRNKGMAFGMMNQPGREFFFVILVAASVIAIGILAYWYLTRRDTLGFSVSLGICLMIGGAAGNLVDRVRLGEVVDFIDLYVGSYHWPAFNIADSAVSVGAFLVALGVLRTGKQ
jgi:signal peptidase II